MKKKLFLLLCTLLTMIGVQAQTDVTSTYLTNADFSSTTPLDNHLCGYGKDMTTNSTTYYGFQAVDGWTAVVTAGVKDDKGYENSGMGAAVFSYGSTWQLKGNNKSAPAKNPNDEASGKCFGFFGVWGNGGYYYQDVTLAPGNYTIIVPMYNQSGTQTNTTYTGFFPQSGSNNRTIAVNPTVGQWANQSVTFTLTEETAGQIRIGYQSTGNGSGSNPHIFIDRVKIEYTDLKAELRAVIAQAQAINARISTLSDDITTAQGVLDNASASKTTIDGSVTTLRSAIETKLAAYTGLNAAGDDITSFIANNGFETSPTFDGTSLGSNTEPKSNATPTDGSTLLYNAKNVYQINGWELLTTETSDFARTFTMPYNKTLYVWGNNNVAGQAVTSPTNGSSVSTSNNDLLFVEANWCENAVLGVKQTIPLPAGSYRLTFDSYVTNAISNADSRCGVSYDETTDYKWPAALNTWTANEVDFTLDAQTDVTISMGYKKIGNVGGGSSAFLFVDNVKLTYYNPLALAKIQWAEAKEAAENFDQTVKMSAATLAALNDAIDTYATDAIASSEDIDEVNDAKDALTTAVDNANASKDVYATLNTAITTVEGWTATTAAAGLRTKYNNGTYNDETTVNDIYAEYQAAEISALAADGSAVDWTSVILNASFETGDMTGWSAESRSDTGVKDQSNGTYSITSGDPVDGSKLFNSWGGTAENNVYQTIKNLPAGTYTLTALLAGFKDESLVLAAGATTNNVVVAGDKTVGYTVDVKFTLDATGDVVIKASNTKAGSSDASFIKADNFRLYKGDVMTDDYTALNTAIADAETYTLGFENAEYAPYNNVAALTALANAKAVNQDKKTAQPLLDGIVSDLTSAKWTANAGEVNAFYKGDFDGYAEDTSSPLDYTPNGWTATANFRMMLKNVENYPGLADASAGTAAMSWSAGITYGETVGYTMPLKANTIYRLQFKAAGWNNETRSGMSVSILNGTDGMALYNLGTPDRDIKGNETNTAGMTSYDVVFATGAAGNYVFHIQSVHNMVVTDFSITKAASQTLAFADDAAMPSYAPGTYPSVSISRTIASGKWSTLVVPVSMDIPGNLSVKEMDSFDENTLSFKDAESIVAGTPYMVKPTSDAVSTIEATDVAVAALSDVHNITKGDLTMKGVYASGTVDVSEGNTNRYIVSGNQLHKVTGSAVNIKPFRAYFELVGSSSARDIIMNLDEATIINALEASEAEGLKDGKYLVKGKIVLVKNGVKFNANGQILK